MKPRILLTLGLLGLGLPAAAGDGRRILDLRDERAAAGWFAVDDRVMGGASRGHFTPSEGGASFHGELSLENGGGFSSVRSPSLTGRFEGATRLQLRVRGDGRSYELCLTTTRSRDGVLHRASFDTIAGEWIEVDVPLSWLRPTWRGRQLESDGPVTGSEIAQLGFMVADAREGPFRLEVSWVEAR